MDMEKLKKALDELEKKKENWKEFEKKMQEVIELLEEQLKGYGKKWESKGISANALVRKKKYKKWEWYSKEVGTVYLYWDGRYLDLAISGKYGMVPAYKKLPWLEWDCLYVDPDDFFKAVDQLLDYLSKETNDTKQLEKIEKIKQILQD